MGTCRTAKVCIRNNTTQTLKVVALRHRGSKGRQHAAQWSDVEPGQKTSPLLVEYETSLASPGSDWWLLAWVYASGDEIFVTDPSNVADAVDRARTRLVSSVPDFAAKFNAALSGVDAEEALDAVVDDVVAAALLAGWQRCGLSKAESDRTLLVEIEPNNDVLFTSRSGQFRTATASRPLETISDQFSAKLKVLSSSR